MGPNLFAGIRRSDVALVAVLAAMGVYLMLENIRAHDADIRIDSHSWLLVPVWLAAVLPLLWWRHNPLAAAVLVTVVMAGHLLVFGWVARCGSGLPLAWVVAFSWCAAKAPRWSSGSATMDRPWALPASRAPAAAWPGCASGCRRSADHWSPGWHRPAAGRSRLGCRRSDQKSAGATPSSSRTRGTTWVP